MNVADELDVSPWDSLLTEVKVSTGRIAWIDSRLQDAVKADDEKRILEQIEHPEYPPSVGLGAGVKELLIESRAERRHRATVSKAAIDAGVAERLVRSLENEGLLVAKAIIAGLDALSFLSVEQRTVAVAAAHAALLSIDGPAAIGGPPVIEGETG